MSLTKYQAPSGSITLEGFTHHDFDQVEYQAYTAAKELRRLFDMVGTSEGSKMFERNLRELEATAKRKAA